MVSASWQDGATPLEDVILIFKGFSSSLMQPTNPDPDVPVLPPQAKIVSIDRLASPYTPEHPTYLDQNLSWASFQVAYLKEIEAI